MFVLGVEGSEKKNVAQPQDNFWNSPYPLSAMCVLSLTYEALCVKAAEVEQVTFGDS